MNVLQKRLVQIGTEPHENGLRDGIVYEDIESQYYWIYNHYSYCEWLKHYMVHYAGLSWEGAAEKLAQGRLKALFATPPKDLEDLFCITHELTYHNAMEITKENRYWQDGTPSDTNGFQEEHDAWYEKTKEKYHLNEEYEILSFEEALKSD
ncbi:hypothetical protein [Capnocytophaga sp. oral taxon 338]|uniref:hypothetical protein n=1 Tax=Capnocytophaga sp. oral taxon 338 TaxID=710239 RepID=UPI000202ED8D|nr:hypothetical protein [Capnocytophaga sp. oral taxon 338]EGD33157.1 hypothetical protein HMPREF9071_2350 [Capnocytophaga sp. oral taxon 338 str. F0234]